MKGLIIPGLVTMIAAMSLGLRNGRQQGIIKILDEMRPEFKEEPKKACPTVKLLDEWSEGGSHCAIGETYGCTSSPDGMLVCWSWLFRLIQRVWQGHCLRPWKEQM